MGLSLSALEKMLGRGRTEVLVAVPPEDMLCELFGVPFGGVTSQVDVPIAPVSAAFDGLGAGCWLRADPVHLRLQRDQMLLLPNTEISAEEATQMCASLNEHFAGQGMEFFAPHPLRWYVRLDAQPDIQTRPLSQVVGGDVRGVLPIGVEAAHWHQMFNEIQMLLHAHPLNQAREVRGALPVNSVWFWGGGGEFTPLKNTYQSVHSDEVMVEMFAAAAGNSFSPWLAHWHADENMAEQLLFWTGLRSALLRGDLATWRTALQDFENGYAQPLWQALRAGKIARLKIDILSKDNIRRVNLTRGTSWAFWRRTRRLADYSMV